MATPHNDTALQLARAAFIADLQQLTTIAENYAAQVENPERDAPGGTAEQDRENAR